MLFGKVLRKQMSRYNSLYGDFINKRIIIIKNVFFCELPTALNEGRKNMFNYLPTYPTLNGNKIICDIVAFVVHYIFDCFTFKPKREINAQKYFIIFIKFFK